MIRSAAISAIVLALASPCVAAPAEQKAETPVKAPQKVAAKPAKGSEKAAKGSEKTVDKPSEAPSEASSEDKRAQVLPKPVFDGPILPSPARLARVSDTLSQGPVTHAVTRFGDWSVACEIQGKVKACFASTYYGVDGVVMKLKVGPTELDLPTKPRRRGTERFVLSVEGPQGLDPDVGYAVVAGGRSGVIPLGNDCDKDGCRSFVDVSDDGAPLLAKDQRPGMIVLGATRPGRAFVWRFSSDGFAEAFEKMKEETRPAGPSEEEIRAKREAEVAEAKAKAERERVEAEAKAEALRVKATGVAGGWEVGKVAEVAEDGKKIRVIDISASSEAAGRAAAMAATGAAAGAGAAMGALLVPVAKDQAEAKGRRKANLKPKAKAKPHVRQAVRPFVPRS